MNAVITPKKIKGSIVVPASKSLMQRACAGALLHHGTTYIHNAGNADDDVAALKIIQQLGAKIHLLADNSLQIISHGVQPVTDEIDCNESGLSARLFTTIAATYHKLITVNGRGSLLKRPMSFFHEVLPKLNVEVLATNNFLPITLKGPLVAKSISIDGSLSSQFLTGLLFAYAFTAREKVTIDVHDLNSKPYIDLTLRVLKQFGKSIINDGYNRFVISPTNFREEEVNFIVEGDWSSASYWIVAGLLNGNVELKGLDENSLQADKAILNVVKQCGGKVLFKDDTLTIRHTNNLQQFHYDATDCPDLFPVLSVLASCCKGTSSIKGLHRLLHKESNRKMSICEMLNSFRVDFYTEEDTLNIHGTAELKSCTINSFNDHRIAMSAAIGALKADGNVNIQDAECVSKSYPDFFEHLNQLSINTTSST